MGQLSCKTCDCQRKEQLTEIRITEQEQDFNQPEIIVGDLIESQEMKLISITYVIKIQSIWRAHQERKVCKLLNKLIPKFIFYLNSEELRETLSSTESPPLNSENKLPFRYRDGSTYIGDWRGGFRDGYGSMTWFSGAQYSGNWSWGYPNGHGKFIFPDGDFFEGDWKDTKASCRERKKNDMRCNDGYIWLYNKQLNLIKEARLESLSPLNLEKLSKIYHRLQFVKAHITEASKAAANAGIPSHKVSIGIRTFRQKIYPDGCLYIGEWKGNIRDGRGKFVDPVGGSYEGEWKNDKEHGAGKKIHSDGSTYMGTFVVNMKEGYGEMMWEEGTKYKGEWKRNQIEGIGEYAWNDGKKYIGEWQAGNMNGFGVMILSNGEKYEGSWANGKRHGKGFILNADGVAVEGLWKNGYLLDEI